MLFRPRPIQWFLLQLLQFLMSLLFLLVPPFHFFLNCLLLFLIMAMISKDVIRGISVLVNQFFDSHFCFILSIFYSLQSLQLFVYLDLVLLLFFIRALLLLFGSKFFPILLGWLLIICLLFGRLLGWWVFGLLFSILVYIGFELLLILIGVYLLIVGHFYLLSRLLLGVLAMIDL